MGFGCLLDLTITTTPAKLGYWLVDKFNHMDRKLQLYGGEKIHLNEDDVYLALGLPRGTIEIVNKKKKSESELLKDWVRLYKVSKPTNITATKVLDMIQSCEGCDDWFKRNFIVLMVTCLFESTSNGMANLRMIHLLDDLSSVVKMNWCSYLIRCLVGTKKSWNDNRRRKNFTGPLLFLTLFYVDKVVLSIRTVARTFPIFKAWNNDLLKDRERAEILTGAFGRGYVDVDIRVPDPSLRVERKVISPNGDDTKSTSELSVKNSSGTVSPPYSSAEPYHTHLPDGDARLFYRRRIAATAMPPLCCSHRVAAASLQPPISIVGPAHNSDSENVATSDDPSDPLSCPCLKSLASPLPSFPSPTQHRQRSED
ncbi:Unknown protein [Striga hermonthica]|uniref:Uncharacterized protein n=1 Tax=Striga hermonthica TaxID=68872 RepID=A0A9N7P122_STRHE|nr:Unknown protein [Striga hermonthica]